MDEKVQANDITSDTTNPPNNPPHEKAARIASACKASDVLALVALATSSQGLLNDEHRRAAWPILLGCPNEPLEDLDSWTTLPEHKDEGQVKLDVDRAFVYYPYNEPEKKLDGRRAELSTLITSTLRHHPTLCYFQGYHDIAQVFLLVLGRRAAAAPVARLSLLRIRDFMLPTLSGTTPHLDLLPAILHAADPEVERHLAQTQPFFALSATLTLYAHDIEAYGDIARLFDFLLASEAAMSIYLFAIIILSRKSALLSIPDDEPEMLHSTLSKLPKPLDLDHLIHLTAALHAAHPPETLPRNAWRQVSSNSVLKTTRDPVRLARQTLADGERLLARQAAQLRNLQRLEGLRKAIWRARRAVWKGRRRAGTGVGVAVAVGVVAWWVRREGGWACLVMLWQRIGGGF